MPQVTLPFLVTTPFSMSPILLSTLIKAFFYFLKTIPESYFIFLLYYLISS